MLMLTAAVRLNIVGDILQGLLQENVQQEIWYETNFQVRGRSDYGSKVTHASDIPRMCSDCSARHPFFGTLGTRNRWYAFRRVFCTSDRHSDCDARHFASGTPGRHRHCDGRRQICIHLPWEHSNSYAVRGRDRLKVRSKIPRCKPPDRQAVAQFQDGSIKKSEPLRARR
jgi:hypothetical protein